MKSLLLPLMLVVAVPVMAAQPGPGLTEQAQSALDANQLDKAVTLAKQAVAANPRDEQAWNVLGVVARNRQQWAAAIGYFDHVLAIDPKAGMTLDNRAYCNHRNGNMRAAIRDYRAALALDPGDKLARANIGEAYLDIYRTGPKTFNADATAALPVALKAGDTAAALKAIADGADVGARSEVAYGGGPLALAAITGNLQLVDVLLDHGADINAQDRFGLTAIARTSYVSTTPSEPYYQATQGMIAALLARGARIDTKDREGKAALYGPTRHGDTDIVRQYLAAGADPQGAFVPGHPEISKAMQLGGASPTAQSYAAPQPAQPSVQDDLAYLNERVQAVTAAMNQVNVLTRNGIPNAPTQETCEAARNADEAMVAIIRRIGTMRYKPMSDSVRAQLVTIDTNIREQRNQGTFNYHWRLSCKWTFIYPNELPEAWAK